MVTFDSLESCIVGLPAKSTVYTTDTTDFEYSACYYYVPVSIDFHRKTDLQLNGVQLL